MPICDKCGWKTNSDRIFKIHVKTCTAEPVKVEKEPSEPEHLNYDDMTKNELVVELVRRGIEFNKRQNKDELIDLLKEDDA